MKKEYIFGIVILILVVMVIFVFVEFGVPLMAPPLPGQESDVPGLKEILREIVNALSPDGGQWR